MAKYNWTIDNLNERLNYLYSLLDKTLKNSDEKAIMDILEDIEYLEEHIENYNDFKQYDMMSVLECFQELKKEFKPVEFLWDDFNEFDKFSHSIKIPNINPVRCNLSKDDLLDFSNDFFKSLNKDFYSNFMKSFRLRKDHIRFYSQNSTCNNGETIFIKTTKETFLSINRLYTVEDCATIAHEFGHSTCFQINPNHYNFYKLFFTEIEGLFFDIISLDYYYSKTNDYNAIIAKIKNHNLYCEFSHDVSLILSLINTERMLNKKFTSNKDIRQNLDKTFFKDEINTVLQSDNLNLEIYLTSYMFAIELYNLYKMDKDKALYILKKIILLDNYTAKQYYDNIVSLGLIPNKGLLEYQDDLKEESRILLR